MSNEITLTIGGALELILKPPPPEIITVVSVRYGNFTAAARGTHMAYTLPVDKMIEVKVAYVDSHGNAAAVDGDVVWASSDEALATVTVSPDDSTECQITPVGPAGSAQITATADADLGAGVRELVTMLDLTLIAGEAVAGTISVVGDQQPIPTAKK